MARQDLYVCDVCEKSEALASIEPYPEARRRGVMHPVPPLMPGGWGHVRLHTLPKAPTVEKADVYLDFKGIYLDRGDTIAAVFRPTNITRIVDIDVKDPGTGWNIVQARVGNVSFGPHAMKSQPLDEFVTSFRNRRDNGVHGMLLQPPTIQSGMECRIVLSCEKSSDMKTPTIVLMVESLRPPEKSSRESGDAIICADCLGKLSIRVGEHEVKLTGDYYTVAGPGMGDMIVGDDIGGEDLMGSVVQFPIKR